MGADGTVTIVAEVDDSQAQGKLNSLKEQIATMTKEQAQAEKDLAAAKKEQEKANQNLLKQQKELANLEAKQAAAEAAREPLIQQAEALKAQMAEATAEAQRYKQAWIDGVGGADRDWTAAQERLASIKAEYDAIMMKIEKEDAAVASATEKVNQQAAAVKSASDELTRANMAVDTSQSILDGVNQRLTQAQAEAGKMAALLTEAAQAIREAEAAAQELEIENFRASAEQADSEIVSLNQELTELTARQKELESMGIGLGYKEYDEIVIRINEINAQLREYRNNLLRAGEAGEEAGGIGDILRDRIGGALDSINSRLSKLTHRILGLTKRVFFFSVITSALRSIRTYMSDAIKQNDEASASFARLSAAAQTLAQPILNVLIPVLTTLANVIATVLSALASLFAMLSGKTLQDYKDSAKALNDEKNALKGVGGAAKDASRQLAAFDEINKLTDSSGGGGGGGSAESALDFEGMTEPTQEMLEKILSIAQIIGAVLLGWKIGSALGLGLTQTLGLMVGIWGIIGFISEIFDMWQNEITFDNLNDALTFLTVAAIGLGIAFGPVGAGIALVVGGLALLVTGFHDASKNGMNWANTLTMIAGLLAAGIGIGIMTGHWFPLFIAAVAGALLAIVEFAGNGEELMEGLQVVFDGFSEFMDGVFSGDMSKVFSGLDKMGQGFKKAWSAVVQSVREAWASFVQWFNEKTNGEFHQYLEAIGLWFGEVYDSITTILSGIIDFIAGVFTGDWDRAWKGLQNIFVGIVNRIITAFEGMINFIISGINLLTRGINDNLKFSIPSWVPKYGGNTFGVNIPEIPTISLSRVPALAQGAVIPPNREFLAVLGDQTSGTNIEAPADLIRQIVAEAMSAQSGDLYLTVKIGEDKIIDKVIRGINRNARANGGASIKA